MKAIYYLSLLGILILGNCYNAAAQCDDKETRKKVKAGLKEYVFETASSKQFNAFREPRKVIDATFSVYADEQYRVLNLCAGFKQKVIFSIYDSKKKLIYSNDKNPTETSFDFKALETGDYTIRFNFTEESTPTGCVSFAVGYKL
ncbi:MAG: hypothetical protein ACOVMN_05525 [Flexibacteraceae bacterium]|jgi:hypothetical protein